MVYCENDQCDAGGGISARAVTGFRYCAEHLEVQCPDAISETLQLHSEKLAKNATRRTATENRLAAIERNQSDDNSEHTVETHHTHRRLMALEDKGHIEYPAIWRERLDATTARLDKLEKQLDGTGHGMQLFDRVRRLEQNSPVRSEADHSHQLMKRIKKLEEKHIGNCDDAWHHRQLADLADDVGVVKRSVSDAVANTHDLRDITDRHHKRLMCREEISIQHSRKIDEFTKSVDGLKVRETQRTDDEDHQPKITVKERVAELLDATMHDGSPGWNIGRIRDKLRAWQTDMGWRD